MSDEPADPDVLDRLLAAGFTKLTAAQVEALAALTTTDTNELPREDES